MAETTKQITFKQTSDECTGRTTYKIKRLFNMHQSAFGATLRVGATYDANNFQSIFAKSKELQGVDIILE